MAKTQVDNRPAVRVSEPEPSTAKKRPLILVVHNEPHMVRLIRINLEQAGFDTDGVTDSREAHARAKQTPPALVICRALMPGLSYDSIIRQFRQYADTRDIPFILIIPPNWRFPAFRDDYYRPEPFIPPELVAQVKRILSGKGPFSA